MNRRQWKNLFALLGSLSGKHKDVLVSLVLMSFFAGIRPYIAVILTGVLIDAVYAGAGFELLLKYAAVGVGGTFLLALADSFLVMCFNRKLEYMQEIQAFPLNRKSMEMDYQYLEDIKVHEMRQRIEKFGGWSMTAIVLSSANKAITALTGIITAVFVVVPMFASSNRPVSEGFAGSWLMSVLFLAAIMVLVWLAFKAGSYFNKKVADARKEVSGTEARFKYYLDNLSGYEEQKDLRVCKQQKLYEKEIRRLADEGKKTADRMAGAYVSDSAAQQSVSAVMGFLVYIFAGTLAWTGIISIGGVVTYAASILKLTDAVAKLAYQLSWLKEISGFAEDYVQYRDLPQRGGQASDPRASAWKGREPVRRGGEAAASAGKDGSFTVEFDHVSFRYPGSDVYVIKDLSLTFGMGRKMAIVGKNGSGKTTFIKLLCRLYDVTEGCIRVNGVDIREYDYGDYCDLFAVVFQDFRVFSFPLGENVAAGNQVDTSRAEDALERAGLGERLKGLPDKLHTNVGKEFEENGVNFSGGEKQKTAIARAIYKDAPFVIMDEPTAALDPESECEVYAGFDKMVGNKTAIYISHRLASCRFCQDILVFDQGRVIQRGCHEELEKQEGLYRELWNAQAQYYT